MLRQLLVDVKTPKMNKKEIVYRIPCQDCEAAYIGETGRSLQKCITEHKYAVRTNDQKNGVAVHAWDNDHRPDQEAAEIVERAAPSEETCTGSNLDLKDTPELQPRLRTHAERGLDPACSLKLKFSIFHLLPDLVFT